MESDNDINLRNPFAGFNASLMNDDEIIRYWIEPHVLFGRTALGIDLTGNIPVVLMGGRGTGKTMLLKFMSNEIQIKEYLSKHKNGRGFLKEANYLGVYHRFDGPSLASFADRNVTDEAWETIFKHYLEVVIGQNYVTMLRNLKQAGCIDLSDDTERSLISEVFRLIGENAIPDPEERTLDSLIALMQKKLDRVFEFINKSALSKEVGFSDDVLIPGKLIFRLPDMMQRFIPEFQGKNIIILLDEYENLRFSQDRIFSDGFFGKTFICVDRTAMVRIAFDACKKPENVTDARILSTFLRGKLTDAEKIAVLWRLGQRKWHRSRVKSSIQVDGVVMPRKAWKRLKVSQQKTSKQP